VASPGTETMLALERQQVAAGARLLAERGLVLGTSGNLSARRGDLVAVTPTGARLADLDPGQVSVVDREGRVVAGELEPTSELNLHLEVYGRFACGAVVHAHPPVATALSCVVDEVPCVHYEMLALGGAVPVASYETFGTSELAQTVADALEGRRAALMANHGAVVHAADVPAATDLALLLEWACTVYWRAAAIGAPRVLGDDRLAEVAAVIDRRRYGATRPV